MRLIILLVVSVLRLTALPPAGAATDPAKVGTTPVFSPTKTVVAVLPVVNGTGKRGEEMDNAMVAAREIIVDVFSTRGFQIVPQDKVIGCLSDKKIDVSDEESRGKANLCGIGEELTANLVVCCIVEDLDSSKKWNVLSMRKVGKAKLQMKVVDRDSETYLINDNFTAEKKGGWIAPELSKAKGLRDEALGRTISAALGDFLKPYPVVARAGGGQGEKPGAK